MKLLVVVTFPELVVTLIVFIERFQGCRLDFGLLQLNTTKANTERSIVNSFQQIQQTDSV
jgi:hypothetical protein